MSRKSWKLFPILLAAGATLLHAQVTITTGALPNAFLNTPYNFVLTAHGIPPYDTWGANGLPPGLIVNGITGAITGAPTAIGTFFVSLFVQDGQEIQAFAVLPLTVTVYVPPLQITTYPVLPQGTAGVAYSGSMGATGGTPPYTFAIISGALPAGLTFSSSGSFGGTPTVFGSSKFTVQVTDSAGGANARDFTLFIAPAKLTLTTAPLSNTILATPLNIQFTASGGVPPYTFVEFGPLPPGTQLSASGALTGTPTTLGTFQFLVFVDDSTSTSASQTFSITIVEPGLVITTATPLPGGLNGSPYSTIIAAVGGLPPYFWSAKGLPTGLVLANTTGLLTGIPTQDGVFTVVVTVTDSSLVAVFSTTQNFSLTIKPIALIITNAPLPNGTVGAAYTALVSTSGGDAPITITATGLPPGITLSAAGAFTGTPTTAGTYTVTINVTDVNGLGTRTSYTITIAPLLVITTASLGPATLGSAFSTKLAATGGTPPYVWVGSNLPAGLSLAQDGTLSGTPTLAGTASFSVTVIDSNSIFATKMLSVTVVAPTGLPLVITTTSIGAATLGSSFSTKFAATGGTSPYTWGGLNLPAGLSLAQDGTLSGTPTLPGTASFSVTVIDSNAVSTTKTFSLTVGLPTGPGVAFSGIGATVLPATQPSLTVALGAIYPTNITVNLTMTVVTDSGLIDPAFQFASGGLIAQTVVPAGSTGSLTAVPIQLGTDAATVTITAQLLVGGQDVTPSPASKFTFRLNPAAPVITSMTAARTSTGFTVTIVGYATSRDVTTANFTFSATSGSNLGTTQLAVAVSSVFAPWYSSAPSAPYGSQFTFTQPFTVTGSNTAILSVSATLTNSVGISPAASANLQ